MQKELLRPWVKELTLQQQSVLVLALRGCDGVPKEDPSKKILRYYRFSVIQNARPIHPDNIFMLPDPPTVHVLHEFLSSTDHYPVHWLLHFTHGCEVAGYKHDDPKIRLFWFKLYTDLVSAFHMNAETELEMDNRLRH
jgi:hypothetical protein